MQNRPAVSRKTEANQAQHNDRERSRLRHLITYNTLRRCTWYNLAGAMLYVFGGCLPRAIWFTVVPLENEATGTNTGFPWFVISYGPGQVNETAFGNGMNLREYMDQTCDARKHADFLEWVEHLRTHTDISGTGDNSLDNQALITIGPQPNGGEKCITFHSHVTCDPHAANEGHRVNSDDDSREFHVEVRGRRVCARRVVSTLRRWVRRSHGSWQMNLQIQCRRSSTCRDESGSWCRTQLRIDEVLFRRVCGNGPDGQPVMPVIRERCQYSCTIAGEQLCADVGADRVRNLINSRDGSRVIPLPAYLRDEANAFCEFRTAIVYGLYMVRVALYASVGVMVGTTLVILQFQWERLVVGTCALLQFTCCLFFAYYFLPLCFQPHSAPSYARNALRQFLSQEPSDELLNDQQLVQVHRLFMPYLEQSVEWTAEVRIVMVAFLCQVWGFFMTIGWWTEVIDTRRVNAGTALKSVLQFSAMTLIIWPIVQTGKFLERIGVTSSEYSALSYGTRTGFFCWRWRRSKDSPYYEWEWKHLGDRPQSCLGLGICFIPPALGQFVGDLVSLPGHLQRMYEWDGFLEKNRICSAQEKKDMESMGINNRCMHNLLAWRRSVLVLSVLMGAIVMPMGLFETSRAMTNTNHDGHGQDVLLWPTEWEDFQLEWRMHERAAARARAEAGNANGTLDAMYAGIQPATFSNYTSIQSSKFFSMLGNVDSGATQWLNLVTVATEMLAFFSVLFGLVGWLWWSLSKKLVLYAAVALVYTPIVSSLLPTRYFVRDEAWSDIDVFTKAVLRNSVQHMGLDMSVVDCWQTIDTAMTSVTRFKHASFGLCRIVTGRFTSSLIGLVGAEDFVTACEDYNAQNEEITAQIAFMEGNVKGACVGMQEAFFGEHDDEIPFTAIYNRTIVSMITERSAIGQGFFDQFMEGQKHTIRFYAGGHSAFNTFITLLPACISVVPATLVAAWRVRLIMPLSRLPGVIIMSLPWIYCPILWVQMLPLWQLTDPLLCASMLCLCFGMINWIFTSYVFGTTDPMPGEQLSAALRKQGWIDFTFNALAFVFFMVWFLRPQLQDEEVVVEDAYGIRDSISSIIGNWRWAFKQLARYAFKYLILRLAAMDFIMSQLMSDHLFEMGINHIRQVVANMNNQGEDHDDNPKRARSGTAGSEDLDDDAYYSGVDVDTAHMEWNDWTQYDDWELIAMQDVVDMAKERDETLEALSHLEAEGLLLPPGQQEAPTEIELAEVSLEECERDAMQAEMGGGQHFGGGGGQRQQMNQPSQSNFFTLMGEFRPDYRPEVYERRKSMRQPLIANQHMAPQFNVQRARRASMAARTMNMAPQMQNMR